MSSAEAPSLLADLTALLALQAIDTRIDRARAALAALDTGANAGAQFKTQQATAEAQRTTATKALAEQKDAEMRLASIETKAAQVTKTMFSGTVTGSRELENLQRELDMLKRQKDDAEGKVLEAMEVAGDATTAADGADKALAAAADQYRKVRAAFKERHTQLTEEIAAHEAERLPAAKAVSAALRSRYDAIRAKKNGIGVAALEDDDVTCGACHTRINTTLAADIKAAQTVQTCEYCGRILAPNPLPA